MKYKMKVVVYNPKDNTKNHSFDIDCEFFYSPNAYGNGHSLSLVLDNGSEYYEDLRYFTAVPIDNKIGILAYWAISYWSGKDGAYAVKSLEISKAE